ncbi:TetR/AcrR family transcriptional regulator [Nocardia sp. NPDC058114]|uniref:TetR/AcrR family transcriptional regulator n=1 Tax=Nocardia sp. NPDC058114 TaxID=3346346 RepID=UPI0036D8A506
MHNIFRMFHITTLPSGTPLRRVRPASNVDHRGASGGGAIVDEEKRRRPGGRSARVRESVIDATLKVLADKGLTAFAVAEVVALSQVHETTIYRRWGSREDLIVDALSSAAGLSVQIPDTGSIRSDLDELLNIVSECLGTPTGRLLNQALSFGGDDPRWTRLRDALWDATLRPIYPITERAVRRGELPVGIEPRMLLETLLAPLQLRALVLSDPLDPQLRIRFIDMILHGAASAVAAEDDPDG